MILGFNHNIKHNGRTFHVQTEDSGPNPPLIKTHVFIGGNIIASSKRQYSEVVHAADFEVQVRQLMQDQHKTMLRNLVNGVYDETVEKFVVSGALPPTGKDTDTAQPGDVETATPVPSGHTGTDVGLRPLGARSTQEGPAALMPDDAVLSAPTVPVNQPDMVPTTPPGQMPEDLEKLMPVTFTPPPQPPPAQASVLDGMAPEPNDPPGTASTVDGGPRAPLLTPAPLVVGNSGTRGLGTAPSTRRTTQKGFPRPQLGEAAPIIGEEQSVEGARGGAANVEEQRPFGEDIISGRRLDEVILGFLLKEDGK